MRHTCCVISRNQMSQSILLMIMYVSGVDVRCYLSKFSILQQASDWKFSIGRPAGCHDPKFINMLKIEQFLHR